MKKTKTNADPRTRRRRLIHDSHPDRYPPPGPAICSHDYGTHELDCSTYWTPSRIASMTEHQKKVWDAPKGTQTEPERVKKQLDPIEASYKRALSNALESYKAVVSEARRVHEKAKREARKVYKEEKRRHAIVGFDYPPLDLYQSKKTTEKVPKSIKA